MYQLLRGDYSKVEWWKVVCNTVACPKWSFILYLTLHGRLLTKEGLIAWGMVDNTKCVLCDDGNENIDHLFFNCPYSRQVCQKILKWKKNPETSIRMERGTEMGTRSLQREYTKSWNILNYFCSHCLLYLAGEEP